MSANRARIHPRTSEDAAAETNNSATVPLRWLTFPRVGTPSTGWESPTAGLILGSGQDVQDVLDAFSSLTSPAARLRGRDNL